MRDRAPLVVFIDDVQWLDQDSVRFMRALLVHPEPVPALLVCAHRSEGAAGQRAAAIGAAGGARQPRARRAHAAVGPLPASALCALAQRLLPARRAMRRPRRSSPPRRGGSPFFAAELARAAALRTPGDALPSLADALALHVARAAGGRAALALAARARGQPLPPRS